MSAGALAASSAQLGARAQVPRRLAARQRPCGSKRALVTQVQAGRFFGVSSEGGRLVMHRRTRTDTA